MRVGVSEGGGGGRAFVSLRASDIVQAEVGESEKAVVAAFRHARDNAPGVVFIDEFQALFTERGRGGGGRLATTLLQCMDDISRWRDADVQATTSGTGKERGSAGGDGGRVVVLGATNAPWMVDRAFLRPGRFDRTVHVGLPSRQERGAILSVHVSRMRLDNGDFGGGGLSSREAKVAKLCERMAGGTGGFSGADLAALCRSAAVLKIIEGDSCKGGDRDRVEERHFEEARRRMVGAGGNGDREALASKIQAWRPNLRRDDG